MARWSFREAQGLGGLEPPTSPYQERDLCNIFAESIRSMVCSESVSDFAGRRRCSEGRLCSFGRLEEPLQRADRKVPNSSCTFGCKSHPSSMAPAIFVSSGPSWLQPGLPKACCRRFCARCQCCRDSSNLSRPEGVNRKSFWRRSAPALTLIQPRLVRGLSMRVKLVESNARILPNCP